ncbi:LytR family transcriptional regulator [Pseudomonas putida DOT-T1E]|uniref:LytR family transcriptional regulator n=1 Tax=Pseudomonas putida (strain DOT-T1E) TaxID=1196325 RepID=I7B883_PSEPT|nr:LytR family transcriptional regulator [Pseudomonas putida DOT-T1E]
MMMSVNPQTKKTTIVSIPRDMEVTLPDYSDESPAKLNAARCSNVWAQSRRSTFASLLVRYASTASLRPPRCLPTGWAGRCHPCSFAAASNRASCSC